MIKVLVVEDEEDFFENIKIECLDKHPDCQIEWARSRDTATLIAKNNFFDLAILDQKIPTIDGALDAHVDHGRTVLDELNASSKGMPVLILTALSADDIFSTVARRSKEQRIWGCSTKFLTIDHLGKNNFDRFPTIIENYFRSINGLRDIEIQLTDDSNLDSQELRICQIFVRRNDGVRCELRKLSGGLSGSAVYHLNIYDTRGQKIQNAVLKIGSHKMVETESNNLALINRLPAAASPRLLEKLEYGAKDIAAIAYQLADRYQTNIFQLIHNNSENLPQALAGISEQRANWISAKSEVRKSIAEIRNCVLSDASTKEISNKFKLKWLTDFEKRKLQVHWGCIELNRYRGNFHLYLKVRPNLA